MALLEFDRIKMKKKGIFSGLHVIHPLTGERIPMWFGNFVIASYGAGAVMVFGTISVISSSPTWPSRTARR